MKKLISYLLTFTLLFSFSATAFALSPSTQSEQIEYEYLEDGSYIVTIITENNNSDISLLSTTKTGSKKSVYYNSDNEAMWSITVTGTFTYGDGTSKCTSSSVTTESYNSTWKISDKSATKSGNKASASCTAKQYIGILVGKTVNKTITLTCSSTGTLS